MRRLNTDGSLDLNKMPFLCEDCKAYLEIFPKKECVYHTPLSSPSTDTVSIPETPEEIYSCDKGRLPVVSRTRRVQAEILSKFDPQLHGLLKSLLPRFLGRPSPVKCKGGPPKCAYGPASSPPPCADVHSSDQPEALPTATTHSESSSKSVGVSRRIWF